MQVGSNEQRLNGAAAFGQNQHIRHYTIIGNKAAGMCVGVTTRCTSV
jgi:hypothetical protein